MPPERKGLHALHDRVGERRPNRDMEDPDGEPSSDVALPYSQLMDQKTCQYAG